MPSITVEAGADCTAHDIDIDGGSFDLDGDDLTLNQVPPSPYPIGPNQQVTLAVRDEDDITVSCTTTVTVTNDAPDISPLQESTVLVGGSVQLSVTASDSAGQNLIYSWSTGDCPGAAIVGDDTATPTLSIAAGTSPGLCQVSIEACDACGECASATGRVSLRNCSIDPISFISWTSSYGYSSSAACNNNMYFVFRLTSKLLRWHCACLLSLLRQAPTAQRMTLILMADHMIQMVMILHSIRYRHPHILLDPISK